ncbi:MAG TPA: hypothetical protein VHM26_11320 [Chitinophagaceae bacterium]|jgi:hypothetical protein|nr:hypothetical protein [Chitinophagaceae bacterium]
MLRTIIFSAIAIACFSCSVGKNTIGEIGIRQFAGYTFKKAIPAMDHLDYKVIDNADDFEKLFYGDAVGVANPDFRGQMVVAIVKGVDHKKAGINFIKAEVNGKTMKVLFEVVEQAGPDNSDNTIMATVPRVVGLTKVDFYKGNELMASISR